MQRALRRLSTGPRAPGDLTLDQRKDLIDVRSGNAFDAVRIRARSQVRFGWVDYRQVLQRLTAGIDPTADLDHR